MLEALLGSLLGGVLRLIPEVLKLSDRKNERAHELAMLDKEVEFAKVKGDIVLREAGARLEAAEMDAMMVALKSQADMAVASGKWVAAVSALVRPLVTYLFTLFYFGVKFVGMAIAVEAGGAWKEVFTTAWGVEDMAVFNMVLTFWFVGRVWERKQSG